MLLSELLSDHQFVERHRTAVDASPADALSAARAATPAEMPLVRALFLLRSGPALLTRGRGLPREKGRPLLEQMVEFGFVPLAEGEDEIVVGYVGQPWKLMGGSRPNVTTPQEWSGFDEPGYVKAAMNFRAETGVLSTETRIKATDPASHRRFACYWRLIRPGSGLIRRSWLRAAKRRAEKTAR
ncbi:MAG: hypothetical protein M3R26_00435 [Actinomycetota bacterium]|nr:hypothetical protein [Actinomycetota bacterium]MDQ2984418.1 hypothetical protein [Actinomycetota bacterium]